MFSKSAYVHELPPVIAAGDNLVDVFGRTQVKFVQSRKVTLDSGIEHFFTI